MYSQFKFRSIFQKSYQFCIEAKWDCCQQAENVSHQNEIVTAGVGVLDDAAIIEFVVDEDKNDGHNDANDTDDDHGDVEGHGHSFNVWLDDGSILGRIAFWPPDQLIS